LDEPTRRWIIEAQPALMSKASKGCWLRLISHNDIPNVWRMSIRTTTILVEALALAVALNVSIGGILPANAEMPGSYQTSWVGNTFSGAGSSGKGRWIQNMIASIDVTPDGTVMAASSWDEAGRCIGLYRDGQPNENDPDDEMILECGLAAEADFIVSGDKKHLLPLGEFQGIQIVSPADFLRRLAV
jgi:hypothetical protein